MVRGSGTILLALGVLGAAALLGRSITGDAHTQEPVGTRGPNVVVFLMDDLGYGDLGSYGASDARTPSVDRLAREGVRLTDCYAAAPVCTPTRAAFMTGRYPQRVGLEWAITHDDLDSGLAASEPTLGRFLKSTGYITALIGKWHLGVKPEFHPNRHGFDEFFGFLAGAHDYYGDWNEAGKHDLYENERPVEPAGYLTDEITARAVAFINRHAGKPFFLEVAYNATHWPFQPPGLQRPPPRPPGTPDEVIDRWAAEGTRKDYVRMLERADEGIGRILAALHRHGLTENTLVIFTSDNGGEWLSRNEPLFHRKGSLWEGGIRVPCILRWPEHLPALRVSRQPAITMDLTATILAAAGVQIPADRRLDGIDLIPILTGASSGMERSFFWRVTVQGRRDEAVRHGRWKYVSKSRFPGLLFDLSNDPTERLDLAYRQPEMLAKLKAMHAEWEREVTRR